MGWIFGKKAEVAIQVRMQPAIEWTFLMLLLHDSGYVAQGRENIVQG
jgi:hypothetical protein